MTHFLARSGSKVVQKVVQKWVQNGDPKSPILGSPHCKMGVQKWSKNGPKSEQKVVKKWSKNGSKMGHFGVPPGGSKNGHSGKTQDLMVPHIPFLSFFVTFFVSNLAILPYFAQVATCGFWPKFGGF